MNDPNLPLLEAAVRLLQPLLDELVFVGGCATGLLITDPAAGGIRPTKDVDTIAEVASYAESGSKNPGSASTNARVAIRRPNSEAM